MTTNFHANPGKSPRPQLSMVNDGLMRLSKEELVRIVRSRQLPQGPAGTSATTAGAGGVDQEQQQQQLSALRSENARFRKENEDLKEVCCFLDEERQRFRKAAREWHRFGRGWAGTLQVQLQETQHKLRQLDLRQEALLKENTDLKELCLHLDAERGRGGGGGGAPGSRNSLDSQGSVGSASAAPGTRDTGDGSSSPPFPQAAYGGGGVGIGGGGGGVGGGGGMLGPQSETDRGTSAPSHHRSMPMLLETSDGYSHLTQNRRILSEMDTRPRTQSREEMRGGIDEGSSPEISEQEKAKVREMCNMVLRKLGTGGPAPKSSIFQNLDSGHHSTSSY
ncbi:coiled-coil domain-containing protein 85B-like isoform X2 [Lethenteron reissneri]|uniref:coiled-coil domain-containing protein 85B-like isoform X2 n=1 Tax=Lethenteron reissneri TaxID=7753 RepID=UPI002AB61D61|nr:coiled-coil domain-containing protein 85B-like isoform X2 [Lethenteron reissneri]